jgi:hypothetical protein
MFTTLIIGGYIKIENERTPGILCPPYYAIGHSQCTATSGHASTRCAVMASGQHCRWVLSFLGACVCIAYVIVDAGLITFGTL